MLRSKEPFYPTFHIWECRLKRSPAKSKLFRRYSDGSTNTAKSDIFSHLKQLGSYDIDYRFLQIRWTVPYPTAVSLLIARSGFPMPLSYSCKIRVFCFSVTGGRPSRLPSARARSKPAFVRREIFSDSTLASEESRAITTLRVVSSSVETCGSV